MELIRLENIYKTYHLGEVDVPVLRGVSLSIARGEMVALMGASGSGKTTLMNILGCLDRPSDGKYWLDGQEMSGLSSNQRALVRTEKLGFVFQSFNLLPRTTALYNVLMPMDYAPRRPASADARRWARTLLNHVGLGTRVHHEPSQMSGGQQQRVAIGRSLVNRPKLLLADEPTGNLDSHSSVEILKMFQRLNAEGITVILVTHDANVAAYAHRTIRMVDGQIEDDGPSHRAHHAPYDRFDGTHQGPRDESRHAERAEHGAVSDEYEEHHESGGAALAVAPRRRSARKTLHPDPAPAVLYADAPAPRRSPQLVTPTFRTALRSLRRNKMRSMLTALGIIIGVGAVIAMAEIGQGSKAAIEKTIANMGANRILVLPGAINNGGVSQGRGTVTSLTARDVEEILDQCPAACAAAPYQGADMQVIYGNRNCFPHQLAGTTPSYLVVRGREDLDEGEAFTDDDVRSASAVCLIGHTVIDELFNGQSPIGRRIRIGSVSLSVVGVLSRRGASMMGSDQDDVVLLPWTTLKYRIWAGPSSNTASAQPSAPAVNTLNKLYPGSRALYPARSAIQAADLPQPVRMPSIGNIYVKAASTDAIPQAIEEVTALLRERHHLAEGASDDFSILNLQEIHDSLASTSEQMGILLFIVATISLVVGGVGIMNIMLVSVTERTREIGLRMAVGARAHHILRQFLVEAVMLCLLGGTVGILVGRGASLWIRSAMNWPVAASVGAILGAVLVSVGVGIVFGFYPAWKAARLDPIEALRYE